MWDIIPLTFPPTSFFNFTSVFSTVSLLICLIIAFGIVRKPKSRLPPGPRGLPIFGNAFQFNPVKLWYLCDQYKKKYGPLVYLNLLGQPVVIINTKKAAQDLLVHRAANFSSRPRSIVGDYLTGGMNFVVTPYGELWRKFRRSSQVALSPKVIDQYRSLQKDEMVLMTFGMMHNPKHWTEDVLRATSSIALSIIYDLPPLRSLNDPFATKNNQFTKRQAVAFYPGAHLVEIFPFLDYMPAWVAKWKRDAKKDFKFFSALYENVFKVTKEQVAKGEEYRASFCATVAENQEKLAISDLECAWLAGAIYGAGHDTTYNMITWAIFALIHFPEVQRRAHQEIDEVIGRSRLPSCVDFKQLPYIRAIVQESLRWRPVTPIGVTHSSLQDDYYEGYYIPKGTFCMPNIRSMNHDPEIYGPDASDFKPERHLDSSGNIKDENDEGHFSYGFGFRDCVGRHLANKTLFMAISMLLWSMKIESAKDEHGEDVLPDIDSEEMDGFMIRPARFEVTLTPRFPDVEMILRQARDDVINSDRYKRGD